MELNPPPKVREATEMYLEDQDAFGQWLVECCDLHVDCTATTQCLFASWKEWAERGQEFVGSQRRFAEALDSKGFKRWREPDTGRMGFKGIVLKSEGAEAQL